MDEEMYENEWEVPCKMRMYLKTKIIIMSKSIH